MALAAVYLRAWPFIICAAVLVCAIILYIYALWHVTAAEQFFGRPHAAI
jgi:hypothetical protein